jgi:phosphatidylglycerophosphate synthase
MAYPVRMSATPETIPPPAGDVSPAAVTPVSFHKLPPGWRYLNISVLWIPHYQALIRLLYHLRIRHEVVTALSILSGLAAAWLVVTARTPGAIASAALLVHLKDLFDACDGALARLTGTGHRLGRFLDTIGDGVVFTLWIAAAAWRGVADGAPVPVAVTLAAFTWISLFLQCSYFNFHQLHYVRLAGAELTSQLDERRDVGRGVVAILGRCYDLWFGWQDRLLARWDLAQRRRAGLPEDPGHPANDPWYGHRGFMVANSALCFGTHAFLLILCLVFLSPWAFLGVVAFGLNLYWGGILVARRVVFPPRETGG